MFVTSLILLLDLVVTPLPALDPITYSDVTYACGGFVDGSLSDGVADFNMSQDLHYYMMEDANDEIETYENDCDVNLIFACR